jgi:hypothetical protein
MTEDLKKINRRFVSGAWVTVELKKRVMTEGNFVDALKYLFHPVREEKGSVCIENLLKGRSLME